MKTVFGPLTVFHTHNYAGNYSPEVLAMYGWDPPIAGGKKKPHYADFAADAQEHSSFPKADCKTFPFDGRVIVQAFV